jgi:hypothetical protein
VSYHSPRSTAVHEAGHCVVAKLAGAVMDQANVERRESESEIQLGEAVYYCSPTEIHKKLAISLAGPLAEAIDAGDREMDSRLSGSDLEKVDRNLRQRYGFSRRREECPEYRLALNTADHLLRKNWGAVDSIAKWLLSRGRISGRLIHAIIVAHRVSLEEN